MVVNFKGFPPPGARLCALGEVPRRLPPADWMPCRRLGDAVITLNLSTRNIKKTATHYLVADM